MNRPGGKVLPVVTMRSLILTLLWVGLIGLGQAAEEKPNIIVVFTDDHGWPDLGSAGIYEDLKTPHLDALAASGVRATHGYVTAPQCVPSRAGLLAGRAQNRFGVESNAESLEGFDAQLTIAERLKKAGYATGQIGKWHLGPTNAIPDHGFDDVYAKNANRPCHANFTLEGESIEMQTVDDGLYHLDACSEAALAFIRRHEEQPFFLYLAYRAPHVPLDAPKKYLDRFPGEMPERRRQALAMISAMDDGVGAIVAELEARQLTEKTLIFFIGDNGAPLKIHKLDAPGGGPGWDGSLNEPMNGEKGMLSEGGIRVPFLVSWPGTIPGEQVYEQPVISLDVAATAVELAGLSVEDGELDGINLVPFLSGEKKGAPHEALTWRWISQAAVREGKWKLLRGGEREYLFDLVADPEEKRNLRQTHPEVADRLRTRLKEWTDELDPPGLATQPMSSTWEDYFDFYLEGKPAAPARQNSSVREEGKVEGWIVRNGEMKEVVDGLRVVPAAEGKAAKAFLVQANFQANGPIAVEAKVRNATGGRIGWQWREQEQKDFPSDQRVVVDLQGSEEWQTIRTEIPSEETVIHFRFLLPPGATEIESVTLVGQEKEPGKGNVSRRSWRFGKK